jgi:hypothetical protein
MGETGEEWCIECSDDENYGFTKDEMTGQWEPATKVCRNVNNEIIIQHMKNYL